MKAIARIFGVVALLLSSGCETEQMGEEKAVVDEPTNPRPVVAPEPVKGNYPGIPGPEDPRSSRADMQLVRKHWIEYLQVIQDKDDYANWKYRPYEHYLERSDAPTGN